MKIKIYSEIINWILLGNKNYCNIESQTYTKMIFKKSPSPMKQPDK